MASKSKKRAKRRASLDLNKQLERNLEKGNYKQALKDAKVCYRQNVTEENRRLLECAFMGRAQELCRQGNREAARLVVEDLFTLGVTEHAVEAALPNLLISLGMLDRLPRGNREVNNDSQKDLATQIADHAVLRPNETPTSVPDIREGARSIRVSLDALEKGDEAAALAQLKAISRNSPLADWKFFVRGLAAYYRQDIDEMLANWDRLDRERFAARIAKPLQVLAGAAPLDTTDSRLRSAVSQLERQMAGQSLTVQLSTLQRQIADHDWSNALKTLRTVYRPLRTVDRSFSQRLTLWLTDQFIDEGLDDELERLIRFADPLPLDPRWNRARALLGEEFEDDFFHEPPSQYWRKYAADLQKVETLSQDERNLAQAIVWSHVAKDHILEANGLSRCTCGASHDEEVAEEREQAVECLERSFNLAPSYASAYQVLASMYRSANEPDQAAMAHRRWLENVPDSLDAMLYLINYYLGEDEPAEARPLVERARALKPLDQHVAELAWSMHVAAARHYALHGSFDLGRREFDAADEVCPRKRGQQGILARRAALEFKAECGEAARDLIQQALDNLSEPAALWLEIIIETTRYEMPNETVYYEKRWAEGLKRKCNGSAAGIMCRLLTAHLKLNREYVSRKSHVAQLVAYVRRCTRVKWELPDLRDACIFLDHVKEAKLLAKFVNRGLKLFRDSPYFHFMAGQQETAKGPRRCRFDRAIKSFERAIELGQDSNDPAVREVVEMAKYSLSFLEDAQTRVHSGFDNRYHEDDDGDDQRPPFDLSDLRELFKMIPPKEMERMVKDFAIRNGIDPNAFWSAFKEGKMPGSTK